MADNSPIEKYMLTSDSKAVKVLLWLLNNRDKNNVLYTTLDAVAAECAVTKVTVNKVFQKLYREKFLVRVRNGHYQMTNI